MVKRNFVSGSLDNTVTSWSDSFETKVASGGATTNTSYYFANGQLIAKKDNSGNRTFFHNDHLGSASVVTDASGNLVETTSYDPWGKINVGGTASKFLYTGQENDTETGLHYYNARYYNPDIRRFNQPDDIIQDVYDPQSLNRYSYVRNNPLRYTDPTGHCWGQFLSGLCGQISNTVKSVLAPKPAPKPASTAKLPSNIPNTSINLTSSNKSSNNNLYVPTSKHPTDSQISKPLVPVGEQAKAFSNNPQVDINFSGGKRFLGGGVGVKVNKHEIQVYGSGGLSIISGVGGGSIIITI